MNESGIENKIKEKRKKKKGQVWAGQNRTSLSLLQRFSKKLKDAGGFGMGCRERDLNGGHFIVSRFEKHVDQGKPGVVAAIQDACFHLREGGRPVLGEAPWLEIGELEWLPLLRFLVVDVPCEMLLHDAVGHHHLQEIRFL